jgi:hypothetical protein
MMKTNNKKKGSTAKKLLPATMMLAVSASMLATSTYAWFTMNKEVQVNGLAMRTKVSSNLLISSNNEEGSYKADTLVEGRKALLEPVSSVTAQTGKFYYTLDSAEDGSKAHAAATTNYDTYNEATNTNATAGAAGKYFYDSSFNNAYGVDPAATDFGTAYGYVDYVFYLKATGTAAGQQIRMTKCDLDYTGDLTADPLVYGGVGTGDKAWRVALFAKELTSAQAGIGNTGDGLAVGQLDPAAQTETAKAILALSGAEYFTGGAVATPSTKSAITTGSGLIDTIGAGETGYYKVLVRVWLEGEDTTCNSATYAALESGQWKLDLDFELVDAGASGKDAVTVISTNTWDATKTPTQAADADPIDVVTTAAGGGA